MSRDRDEQALDQVQAILIHFVRRSHLRVVTSRLLSVHREYLLRPSARHIHERHRADRSTSSGALVELLEHAPGQAVLHLMTRRRGRGQ